VRRRKKNTMTPSTTQCCAACGGKLEDTTITHEVKRGTHIYSILKFF